MTDLRISRRQVLRTLASGTVAGTAGISSIGAAEPLVPKSVAGVVTVYQHNSHADVILSKILKGWSEDGGPGPALKLASLYVDQFPEKDISRALAERYGFPIVDSIEEALTLGHGRVAVDGVISVAEHGSYPHNDIGQHLYPRRRFFEEITNAFEKFGQVVPVFNDKHPGPQRKDADWMYRRARELKVPLMAGSSLPVTFRDPDPVIPMGSEIEEVVGIGMGDFDAYGFHTLEMLQTIAERRRGAETGVKWVQCLPAAEMWQTVDSGRISVDVFNAALDVVPKANVDRLRELRGDGVGLFLFEYNDGVRGSLFMLNGVARGISTAVRIRDRSEPVAVHVEMRYEPRFPHFAYLLKSIERFVFTGRSPYPVERTMLTGAVLDRALTSRAGDGRRIETPELAITYKPVDYPHAPHLKLDADPRPSNSQKFSR